MYIQSSFKGLKADVLFMWQRCRPTIRTHRPYSYGSVICNIKLRFGIIKYSVLKNGKIYVHFRLSVNV